MWRNVLEGSRDFYLIRADASRRFGRPEKLGLGTWKINACPMDGGGLVHAGVKTISVWWRMDDIFVAEPGKPETKIGEGKDSLSPPAGRRSTRRGSRVPSSSCGLPANRKQSRARQHFRILRLCQRAARCWPGKRKTASRSSDCRERVEKWMRLCQCTVLSLISFSLISPAVFVPDADSNLPASGFSA
jgi:hypothetical protein